MRDSFVFYRSFLDGAEDLDPETFKRLMMAIMKYALDGEDDDTLTGLERTVYVSWKANVDSAIKRRENGKGGGRPKSENHRLADEKPMVTEEKTNGYDGENHRLADEKPNVNVNVNVNDNVNEKENGNGNKKKGRFAPPTVDEVAAYCQSRKNRVDPETFVDFYASKGWRVGKNPMKDWKAAVRTWEKRGEFDPRGRPEGFDANAYLESIIAGGEL